MSSKTPDRRPQFPYNRDQKVAKIQKLLLDLQGKSKKVESSEVRVIDASEQITGNREEKVFTVQ